MKNDLIRSLNMTGGDILTLEKATDRMEFEALSVMQTERQSRCMIDSCGLDCNCNGHNSVCEDTCYIDLNPFPVPCDCDGPYVYCQPHCPAKG